MPEHTHVLVVNQHGDNRGDEAAMRAMLDGIERRIPGSVRFTVIHQFAGLDRDIGIDLPHEVEVLRMRARPTLLLHGALRLLGLRLPQLVLGARAHPIIAAYERADVVVSAPGGPYFGDIYADHEVVHWLYVWLARVHGLPCMLYAPSVGPFAKRVLNPVRRRGFRWLDAITVREPLSKEHLARLVPQVPVELSVDSALQREVPAGQRGVLRKAPADAPLVAISAIDFRYPGDPDPNARRRAYDEALVACMEHLHGRLAPHFVLLPQLYGHRHSDVSYLQGLGGRLSDVVSWEVLDPEAEADTHQAIIGLSELCIASRYHPQIFAAAAGVPGVCIHYEHKALGFMEELGLKGLALDIRTIDERSLVAAVDAVLERRDEIAEHLAQRLPGLRAKAERSSEIVAELAMRRSGRPAA